MQQALSILGNRIHPPAVSSTCSAQSTSVEASGTRAASASPFAAISQVGPFSPHPRRASTPASRHALRPGHSMGSSAAAAAAAAADDGRDRAAGFWGEGFLGFKGGVLHTRPAWGAAAKAAAAVLHTRRRCCRCCCRSAAASRSWCRQCNVNIAVSCFACEPG